MIPKPTVKSGWEKVEVQTFKNKCVERLLNVPAFSLNKFVEVFLWSACAMNLSSWKNGSQEGERKMEHSKKTQKLVILGMLSGLSYVLMMLNFPIPGIPPFLKIDFSEVPALLAALIFGPVAGLIVEGIKNLLHYLIQGSATGVPVGQLANFVAGLLFILPVSLMFHKFKNTKGITTGLVVGTVVMSVGMAFLNYYVFLPAYTLFLQSPALSSEETRQLVVTGILPFNMIKGIITGLIFVVLVNKMKYWITKRVAV